MASGDTQFTGHESGLPPYRPLSAGAVTALVLSLVLAIPAFLGLSWVMLLPLVAVLVSWAGVASGRRRGRPLLWISLILSVGIGATTWWMQGALAKSIDEGVTPLVAALDKDDRATLETWALASPDRPAPFDVWKARLEAARKDAGPWSGSLRLDRGWNGVMLRLVVPPGDVTEVEPVGAKPIPIGQALWFCAPHGRGDVWLAFELGEPGEFKPASEEFLARILGGSRGVGGPKDGAAAGGRVLRDVRVFLVKP